MLLCIYFIFFILYHLNILYTLNNIFVFSTNAVFNKLLFTKKYVNIFYNHNASLKINIGKCYETCCKFHVYVTETFNINLILYLINADLKCVNSKNYEITERLSLKTHFENMEPSLVPYSGPL